jgi:hypothetical protein
VEGDNGNYSSSGVIIPIRQASKVSKPVRGKGNSSMANNDSKEIAPKTQMYEWMISGADMEIIDNEILRDEERERELMKGEDQDAPHFHACAKSSVIDGTADESVLETSLKMSKRESMSKTPSVGVMEYDIGCCGQFYSCPTTSAITGSLPDRLAPAAEQRATAPQSFHRRAFPMHDASVEDQRMDHEDQALQLSVRPGVLAAIESDMHVYSLPVGMKNLHGVIIDLKRSLNSVWNSSSSVPSED